MGKQSLESLRELAVTLALSALHQPYRWGGNNPFYPGVDCSGLWVWIARKLELLDKDEDYSAHSFWKLYRLKRIPHPKRGALVFYGNLERNKVTHMAICLDEQWCISASNGGRSITSLTRAQERGACVQLKKIRYRSDIWGYADPFMET